MKQRKKSSQQKPNTSVVRIVTIALEVSIVLFLAAALIGGEILGAYKLFTWWDDVLHTVSGVIVGFIGFLMVYVLNARYQMTLSPLFVAAFAFTFAVTLGAMWEIVEFTIDALFRAEMQRWNLPADALIFGKAFQGSGLRDTMSDLILGSIGSLIAAVGAYYAYKYERPTALSLMRRLANRYSRG